MCGVIGVIGPVEVEQSLSWAALEAYRGLLTLQHRGQDAAGILSFEATSSRFFQHKDLGLVADVFNQEKLERMRGQMSLGHTRYATAGTDQKEDLQPLALGLPLGIGMAHNGNLVNAHALSQELCEKYQLQFMTSNDLEVLLNLWCTALLDQMKDHEKNFSFAKACAASDIIFQKAQGGYALVGMVASEGLFALRDPDGIRPLVVGTKEVVDDRGDKATCYCVCSETLALNFLGYEYLRDVLPGEMIFIDLQGQMHTHLHQGQYSKAKSPCMFEWIYFSGAESSIEGRSVYQARLNLGKRLAIKCQSLIDAGQLQADVVCPVPDTSRTACFALSEDLKIPYREVLIKNRYIQRSFILNSQEAREKAVELKLSPVRSEIEGKNLLLVDDSIVRGTTSKKIIALLKRYGACEITLAITCPPIRYACYYGIDFPTNEELIAGEKTSELIAQFIGANRVVFLDESDIIEAIDLPQLCMACLNKDYPTSVTEGEAFGQMRKKTKGGVQ